MDPDRPEGGASERDRPGAGPGRGAALPGHAGRIVLFREFPPPPGFHDERAGIIPAPLWIGRRGVRVWNDTLAGRKGLVGDAFRARFQGRLPRPGRPRRRILSLARRRSRQPWRRLRRQSKQHFPLARRRRRARKAGPGRRAHRRRGHGFPAGPRKRSLDLRPARRQQDHVPTLRQFPQGPGPPRGRGDRPGPLAGPPRSGPQQGTYLFRRDGISNAPLSASAGRSGYRNAGPGHGGRYAWQSLGRRDFTRAAADLAGRNDPLVRTRSGIHQGRGFRGRGAGRLGLGGLRARALPHDGRAGGAGLPECHRFLVHPEDHFRPERRNDAGRRLRALGAGETRMEKILRSGQALLQQRLFGISNG